MIAGTIQRGRFVGGPSEVVSALGDLSARRTAIAEFITIVCDANAAADSCRPTKSITTNHGIMRHAICV
jgi:hypothetical protein